MSEPDRSAIEAAFFYDPQTGILTWRTRPRADFASANAHAVWNGKHAGKTAGWLAVSGHRYVRFAGKCRKTSRLIWKLLHGFDAEIIDHIDGNPGNDRQDNLRDVSQATNMKNRAISKTNTSGTSGVYFSKGSWKAQVNSGGKRFYLGSFPSAEDAAIARKAAQEAHGFHANHGRTGTERDGR